MLFAVKSALAGVIEGRVIEVPDGATLTILSSEGSSIHRVRLAGIDAPGKGLAIGGSSRASLRRMASGKRVRVEANSIDARGMLVAIVQIRRGPNDCGTPPCPPTLDPVLTQISTGLAKLDKADAAIYSQETQKLYAIAEERAKASRLGVWRDGEAAREGTIALTR